jgi:hypothetical protein
LSNPRQLTFAEFSFGLLLELFSRVEAAVRQSGTGVLDVDNAADSGLESFAYFVQQIRESGIVMKSL